MLVLSRKVGERFRIGERIIVQVLAIENRKVRLGIIAPRSTRVLREELYLTAGEMELAGQDDTRPSRQRLHAPLDS